MFSGKTIRKQATLNADSFVGLESINKKLAVIPVFAIFFVMALLIGLGFQGQFVFNPPYLLLALTILFYLLVTPVVAYISARGYLAMGSRTLLFVSLAFFVGIPFSIATVAGASLPNLTVTLGALGLLISARVKRLVEALDGTIQFESEPNKGTKFIVELPPKENS
jgi:predicted PurR-regulated permease PerM